MRRGRWSARRTNRERLRITDLEERLGEHLSTATGLPRWEVCLTFDDILAGLATNADQRLAFRTPTRCESDTSRKAADGRPLMPRRGVSGQAVEQRAGEPAERGEK